MVIYDIREVLRTSVEKKLKADITDAGTMLDGTGADFAFELKGRRYDVQIKDITKNGAGTIITFLPVTFAIEVTISFQFTGLLPPISSVCLKVDSSSKDLIKMVATSFT